ncbi:MAG: 23S rRNA (guanosine(2251)-2'-O)-methyltransferase RlmB [Alphaproteobacteria bacterium]|nr:23S rRNA (guanosine(2251)-2'-O)-methyltransferase RlmB [Alphaproteobacteria bacterium]
MILYGQHAVRSALLNPERAIIALYHCPPIAAELTETAHDRGLSWQRLSKNELTAMLHPDSPHQGLCAAVEPLPEIAFEKQLAHWREANRVTVVILDQVADARNLGAILRSAYCLSANAVLCTERHSASENAHLAKAASGALEAMPLVRVINLARTLAQLKDAGFWCYGFDSNAETSLADMDWPSHCALIFGAESSGMRRLSAKLCDALITIPQNPEATAFGVDSLNLAQSVSIALYARGLKA